MYQKKGIGFIVWGIILGIAGGACILIGNIVDNNLERQWNSFWSSGREDPTGKILLYIGIIVLVLGAILLIVGIVQYATSMSKMSNFSGQTTNSVNGSSPYMYSMNINSGIIIDEANTLSEDEKQNLSNCIVEAQKKLGFGIVIITRNNSFDIPINRVGYKYLKNYNIGNNWCILVIDMSSLESCISYNGTASRCLNEERRKVLSGRVYYYLEKNEIFEAYSQFISSLEELAILKKVPLTQSISSVNQTNATNIFNVSSNNTASPKYCTKCGMRVMGAERYCADCGTKIE